MVMEQTQFLSNTHAPHSPGIYSKVTRTICASHKSWYLEDRAVSRQPWVNHVLGPEEVEEDR